MRRRAIPLLSALLGLLLLLTGLANAQEPAPAPPFVRSLTPGGIADPLLPGAASAFAPADHGEGLFNPPIAPEGKATLVLSARLSPESAPLKSGLVWRVFGATPQADGTLPLINDTAGGTLSLTVDPGVYFVYCGFGHAGTTIRAEVKGKLAAEEVILNAGGLKLEATADEKRNLNREEVRFDIYALETDDRGERKVIAADVRPGDLVPLTADTYQVVSRYGAINAVTYADVEVTAGKLTEVTLFQRAASVTLKLVGQEGGEAIADTHWSILTPGGDVVTEGVGAFPSFVLAAGAYTVIAKHNDTVFQKDFDVETGRDTEIEVLAR